MSKSSQSHSAANPDRLHKSEWTVSSQTVQGSDLIVQHNVQPPGEIEHPVSTHHCISLHLKPVSRRVAFIGTEQYDGSVNKGEFCLHPSTHSGFYSWESVDESIALVIKQQFLNRIAASTECLDPDRLELCSVTIGRDSQIEQIARSFLYEMQHNELGSQLYRETLATQFAIHLLRNYCVFPPRLKQYDCGLSRSQLTAVIDYVEAHLESTLSLQTLAEVADINSTHYFCCLFKQSMHISPYQYVILQRIERAKQLLKQPDLPLVKVALACGFCDQSAFSHAFRKYVVTTPRDYRRQL